MRAPEDWTPSSAARVRIEEVLGLLGLARFAPQLASEDITNLKGLEHITERHLTRMIPPLGPRRLLGSLVDQVFRPNGPAELHGNKNSDFFTTPQMNDPIRPTLKRNEAVCVDGHLVRSGWALTEGDPPHRWTGTFQPRRDGGGGAVDRDECAEQSIHPISQKLQDRQEARRARDFEKADQIREELLAEGVRISEDTRIWEHPDGVCGGWGMDLLHRGTWTIDCVPDFVMTIPRGMGGGGGGGRASGDWTCACGLANYASRAACRSCGAVKHSAAAEGATAGGGGGGGGAEGGSGGW